jgi:acyl dehydratase
VSVVDVVAEGPHFDELNRGDVFESAPSLTLTSGRAAMHQAIVGDRLRLALDSELSRRVVGAEEPLADPALVWDVAIGQSTAVTHHVVANLFYRGLTFRRAPLLGDTLYTRTEVVALRQNSVRPGRRPTGLAALRITTRDQADRVVLDFWRCAMLPLRDVTAETGFRDDLDQVGSAGALDDVTAAVVLVGPWRLDAYRNRPGAGGHGPVDVGSTWHVRSGDVVSSAPELARLTTNIARTHHDDSAAAGRRLVYGGHTIGLAFSQTLRALPDLVTVVGWEGCDHLGPVQEGDTLTSTVTVTGTAPLPDGQLVRLRSRVQARSGSGADPRDVLDWRLSAVLA